MTSIGTNITQDTVSANIPPAKYEMNGFFYKNSFYRVIILKISYDPKYKPAAGIYPNYEIANPQ